MYIRRATPADAEVLVDIWLRSVRATHGFLSESDIQSLLPFVREYLASLDSNLWVLRSETDRGIPQDNVVRSPASCIMSPTQPQTQRITASKPCFERRSKYLNIK
jgi:hypothetical protein